MNKKLISLLALITVGMTLLYLFIGKNIAQDSAEDKVDNEKILLGGDFVLIDQDSKHFNSNMLKNNISLLYFGFTACPDVCIEALQKIDKVLETLNQYKININSVFITLDPKRDTSDALKSYFKHYNPKFIALTGSQEQINSVASKYKVYYTIRKSSKDDYLLDHSTFIYLLDTNGVYIKHFTLDSEPLEIVSYIRMINADK